jgi:hypothetical protein
MIPSFLDDFALNPMTDWNKPMFFKGSNTSGTSLLKVIADANKTLFKAQKLVDRIESAEQTSKINAKTTPDHATIRKEYVRCGKLGCEEPHGPYYYAYWKEEEKGSVPVQSKYRKKLKKKYIGTSLPSRCNRI